MKTFIDLAYGTADARHRLDIMLPDTPPPLPVVVAIHGGAWRGGSKRSTHPYGRILAEVGIATIMANYRLTTTHPHPAQEEDLFALLDWLTRNASIHGIDPDRVGMTGSSAGGHLIALVALKASKASTPYRIRCIAPVCGIFDFTAWVRDASHARGEVEPLLGGTLEQKTATLREISPLFHVHGHAPVCLAIHGESDDDVPCTQTLRFVDALKQAGAEAEARIVPGAGHVGLVRKNDGQLEPLGGLDTFRDFFRRHLLGPSYRRLV